MLRKINLSSHPELRTLRIRCLPTASMDAVPNDKKDSLKTLWKALISWLKTASLTLRTLELQFSNECSLIPVRRMGDFLHDGHPDSVANQVYDWSLLCPLAASGKVNTIVFAAAHRFADYDASGCVWEKYPNTVRVIKNSLPNVKVEFHTKSGH